MTDTPHRNGLAFGLIMASVAAMAFADAVVKSLAGDITLWQIFATRSLIAMAILIVMARVAGARLAPRAIGWTMLRGGLLAMTWLCYYASLPLLSLSPASVAMYIGPVLIVLFASVFLGDRIGKAQWAAVLIGFLGVVLISRPGTDAFSWAILLPMLGAASYATAMLLTGQKCSHEHPLTLSLGMAVSLLAVGLIGAGVLALLDLAPGTRAVYPFLLNPWVTMTPWDWAVIAFLGLLIALYGAGVAKAYQIGKASVVATFDYGYLVSAALWGYVFFAETPDAFSILGMILITAAGLLVLKPRRHDDPAREGPNQAR